MDQSYNNTCRNFKRKSYGINRGALRFNTNSGRASSSETGDNFHDYDEYRTSYTKNYEKYSDDCRWGNKKSVSVRSHSYMNISHRTDKLKQPSFKTSRFSETINSEYDKKSCYSAEDNDGKNRFRKLKSNFKNAVNPEGNIYVEEDVERDEKLKTDSLNNEDAGLEVNASSTSSSDGQLICPHCQTGSDSVERYEKHLKSAKHEADLREKVQIFNKELYDIRKEQRQRQNKIDHSSRNKGDLQQCNPCRLEYYGSFQLHQSSYYHQKIMNLRNYRCDICCKQFQKFEERLNHECSIIHLMNCKTAESLKFKNVENINEREDKAQEEANNIIPVTIKNPSDETKKDANSNQLNQPLEKQFVEKTINTDTLKNESIDTSQYDNLVCLVSVYYCSLCKLQLPYCKNEKNMHDKADEHFRKFHLTKKMKLASTIATERDLSSSKSTDQVRMPKANKKQISNSPVEMIKDDGSDVNDMKRIIKNVDVNETSVDQEIQYKKMKIDVSQSNSFDREIESSHDITSNEPVIDLTISAKSHDSDEERSRKKTKIVAKLNKLKLEDNDTKQSRSKNLKKKKVRSKVELSSAVSNITDIADRSKIDNSINLVVETQPTNLDTFTNNKIMKNQCFDIDPVSDIESSVDDKAITKKADHMKEVQTSKLENKVAQTCLIGKSESVETSNISDEISANKCRIEKEVTRKDASNKNHTNTNTESSACFQYSPISSDSDGSFTNKDDNVNCEFSDGKFHVHHRELDLNNEDNSISDSKIIKRHPTVRIINENPRLSILYDCSPITSDDDNFSNISSNQNNTERLNCRSNRNDEGDTTRKKDKSDFDTRNRHGRQILQSCDNETNFHQTAFSDIRQCRRGRKKRKKYNSKNRQEIKNMRTNSFYETATENVIDETNICHKTAINRKTDIFCRNNGKRNNSNSRYNSKKRSRRNKSNKINTNEHCEIRNKNSVENGNNEDIPIIIIDDDESDEAGTSMKIKNRQNDNNDGGQIIVIDDETDADEAGTSMKIKQRQSDTNDRWKSATKNTSTDKARVDLKYCDKKTRDKCVKRKKYGDKNRTGSFRHNVPTLGSVAINNGSDDGNNRTQRAIDYLFKNPVLQGYYSNQITEDELGNYCKSHYNQNLDNLRAEVMTNINSKPSSRNDKKYHKRWTPRLSEHIDGILSGLLKSVLEDEHNERTTQEKRDSNERKMNENGGKELANKCRSENECSIKENQNVSEQENEQSREKEIMKKCYEEKKSQPSNIVKSINQIDNEKCEKNSEVVVETNDESNKTRRKRKHKKFSKKHKNHENVSFEQSALIKNDDRQSCNVAGEKCGKEELNEDHHDDETLKNKIKILEENTSFDQDKMTREFLIKKLDENSCKELTKVAQNRTQRTSTEYENCENEVKNSLKLKNVEQINKNQETNIANVQKTKAQKKNHAELKINKNINTENSKNEIEDMNGISSKMNKTEEQTVNKYERTFEVDEKSESKKLTINADDEEEKSLVQKKKEQNENCECIITDKTKHDDDDDDEKRVKLS